MKGAFKKKIPAFQKYKGSEKGETSRVGKKVRLFLEENKIFKTKHIKKNTFQYIYDIDKLQLPEKGEQKRLRIQQAINLITIILKIVDKFKILENVSIATYTFNKEALLTLIQLVEAKKNKKIKSFYFGIV